MSSFFEDLNDLISETPPGKVIGIFWLIGILSSSIALGIVYWITH